MSIQLSTTVALVLILVLVSLRWASKRTRLPLPPGPKGYPLIGNLLDVPKAKFAETYTKWAHKYGTWSDFYKNCRIGLNHWDLIYPGKIVYANAAGQPLIILSDVEDAIGILEKKGATCSDRRVSIMAGELAGFKEWTSSLMYGPRFKERRRHFHRVIGTQQSLERFDSLFKSEGQKLLRATLRDPDNVQQYIRRYFFD
jgi:hypothetical protein